VLVNVRPIAWKRVSALGALAGLAGAIACGSSSSDESPATSDDAGVDARASVDAGLDGAAADASSGSDATNAPDASDASDASSDAAAFDAGGVRAARLLASGNLHTCSVRPGGTLKCWGSNADGQVGAAADGGAQVAPIDVGLTGVVEVATGRDHTCARLSDGHVWCWGDGTGGQLGNGGTSTSATPVEVTGLTDAIGLSAEWGHTCAVRANGHVACWGNGGRIGDGTAGDMLTPKEPPGITGVTDVAAGWGHTCVLLAGGAAKCWGTYNAWGQIGDGSSDDRLSPVDVSGLSGAISIVAGSYHTCALMAAGTVKCWGNAQGGSIGIGVIDSDPHPTPVDVPGLTNVVQIAAAGGTSCARLDSGKVYCWGYTVGDGTNVARSSPTEITALALETIEIRAGGNQSCALLGSGAIECWGNNSAGQLGDGTTIERLSPVSVVGL
jgi:hypothetical protein